MLNTGKVLRESKIFVVFGWLVRVFLLTVSALSLFFSLSLGISIFSCCLSQTAPDSVFWFLRVSINDPTASALGTGFFWGPYRGRGPQRLSPFWLRALHKTQLCPFTSAPVKVMEVFIRKRFHFHL